MNKQKKVSKSPNLPKDKRPVNSPGMLPGSPGYRTREGRSGLDPVDSGTEAGHTAGTYLLKLISGQLIIQNPFSLFLWGLLVLVLLVPSFFALFEMVKGNAFFWETGIFLLIVGVLGLFGLNIFIRNLVRFLSR